MVLGLGNPGPRYAATRHNAGAMAVQELAARHGIALTKRGHQSLWGKGRVGGRQVILALPQTYMNASGQTAASLRSYYRLEPGCFWVAHDDLDLPLGRLKVAQKGRASNKGVASVIKSLGTEGFGRLKLGIGRPRYEEPIESYVLSGFYADQRELVERMVHAAADCLEVILTKGPEAAMQDFHRSLQEEEKG